MRELCRRVVAAPVFERFIIFLILFNAVIVGLETSPEIMARWGNLLTAGNYVIVAFFCIEATMKIIAVAPRFRAYFGDGWNLFDFTIVVISLIPASGGFVAVARLARLLRVLRLVSTVPKLRLIVQTLVHSIPGMGHVLMLLSLLFYVYGVAGYQLFHGADPEHWGTLGSALLTLFQIITLEGWADIMAAVTDSQPYAWIYFLSFVLMGTFVVMNLFIAVVLNNLEESKVAQMEELSLPASREEVLQELRATREALMRLERRLEAEERGGKGLSAELKGAQTPLGLA